MIKHAGNTEWTKLIITELEEDVYTIDGELEFFKSDRAKEIFGDSRDEKIRMVEKAKANGVKWCLCPACTAGGAILEIKDKLLS